jgi:hypothetical protein
LTKAGRFGQIALVVLVAGLAIHNVAMAELWDLGVRGTTLDVFAAWKEGLLLVAFLVVAWKARRLPSVTFADVLAVAYTAIIVVYAFVPQDSLGGGASHHGILLALRHHLLPVAGYAFGRLLSVVWQESGRIGVAIALTAGGVALIGLFDLYAIPLQAWRDSGVPGWYQDQLGLKYIGLSGLPENWVFNTGNELNPIRRLVSTFLSPLASSYVFVIALVYLVSRPLRWWTGVLGALVFVGLLYTHTRAAFGALALGLILLAIAQRRGAPVVLAVGALAVSALFFVAYPSIGPSTKYTPEELEVLHKLAHENPGGSSDPFSTSDSSIASHWRNLRDGIRTVVHHPQGFGLGNSGVTAKRTKVPILAGESTYTELGVDAGVAGAAAFVLWSLAILLGLWRKEAWLAAAFAAVLFLGLQTDVIGVPWIAVVVWAAAGLALGKPEYVTEAEGGEPSAPA